MSKKNLYKKNTSEQDTKEPQAEYTAGRRLNFEAHNTFEEMDAAKQAAFMKLSMGERFLKGLELYSMFKEHTQQQSAPGSFILKRRKSR